MAIANQWVANMEDGHVLVSGADNLQQVITAVNQAGIDITTMNTVTGNLEKSLLDMLANDDKGE